MKCSDALEMINAYVDNGIDPRNDTLLAEHLEKCSSCREEAEFLVRYKKAVESFGEVKAPPDFIDSVRKRLEKERGLMFLARRFFVSLYYSVNSMRFTVEAAGLAGLVIVIMLLYRPFDFTQKTVDESSITAETELPLRAPAGRKSPGIVSDKKEKAVISGKQKEGNVKSEGLSGKSGNSILQLKKDEASAAADDESGGSEDVIVKEEIQVRTEMNKRSRTLKSPESASKESLNERRSGSGITPENIFRHHKAEILSFKEETGGGKVYTVLAEKERAEKLISDLKQHFRTGEIRSYPRGEMVELVIPLGN